MAGGGGGGVASKINVLLREMFADPTIKKSTKFFPQPQISIKNIYPPLAKNVTKEYHSVVTHFQYHFCDTSLITACAIFFPFLFGATLTLQFALYDSYSHKPPPPDFSCPFPRQDNGFYNII